ncbi:hypothetical protein [Aporhodopirellula aestuarii]|uniref:Uncharacterized protein n=1 Tax=Aporhodopirellula aestuarii TaxID=2950107 RepID=A0ABT0TYA0_9BACT|nr:hypothetical protein [Aporhodopirellula aestuarii]MCM2369555.1 hypothetical protein [Aporhodopirellula aestuarii]
MNRWLLIGSLMGMLALSTGCLHHNTRGGCASCSNNQAVSCGTCSTGTCGTGTCNTGECVSCNCGNGDCGSSNARCGGLLSKTRGRIAGCHTGCGRATGCEAGPLGWQQGGLDYSSNLNPGILGHQAGAAVASQPFTPGAPTAQVAYPYYTHRGPRDFLMANPPSIGP